MMSNRAVWRRRLGLGVLDGALITVAALLLSVAWLATWLAVDPVPEHLVSHTVELVWIATALLAVLFWRAAGRSSGFMARRWPRLAGLALIAGGGVAVWWVVRIILDDHSRGSDADWLSLQLATFLLAVAGLFMARREAIVRGWVHLKTRLAAVAVLAAVLIWMAWDEAPSASIERNRAAVAVGINEDEATYQLTLRFTPAPGGGQVYKAPAYVFKFPSKEPALIDYLRAHRAEIEANWNGLSAVRSWWAEMAAAPVLGDRTTGTPDQPFIRYGPVRGYAEQALTLARLRALDGDGDGAMAMVEQVYVVGARLGPGARTLVRAMIAVQVQRQALEAADFVLRHAQVAPEARERLARLLVATEATGDGARRLVLTESEYTAHMTASVSPGGVMSAGGAGGWLRCWEIVSAVIRRVAFNSQATHNAMQDRLERVSLLAAARDAEGMKTFEHEDSAELFGRFPMKNLAGRLLVVMATPAFERIVKTYWEIADRRTDLVRRLRDVTAYQVKL